MNSCRSSSSRSPLQKVGTFYCVLYFLSCLCFLFFFVRQPLTVRLSSALLSLETRNKAGGLSLKPRLNSVNSREESRDDEGGSRRKRRGEERNRVMEKRVGGQRRRLRGKECERKEGRKGGRKGTRVRVQEKHN